TSPPRRPTCQHGGSVSAQRPAPALVVAARSRRSPDRSVVYAHSAYPPRSMGAAKVLESSRGPCERRQRTTDRVVSSSAVPPAPQDGGGVPVQAPYALQRSSLVHRFPSSHVLP